MSNGQDIINKQNEEDQIRLLAAQRTLYSSEKMFLGFQMILGIAAAVVGACLQSKYPQAVSVGSAGIALFDVLYLESRKGKKQKLAAKIQELFDCTLLVMEWRKLKANGKPEQEDIVENSAQLISDPKKKAELQNWYPADIKDLPLQPARIVCQRFNCKYDARLRERYILSLRILLGFMTLITLGIAFWQNRNFIDSIALIVAPLLPVYVVCFREIYAQNEALELIRRLNEHCNELWGQAVQKSTTEHELDIESRFLQDEIYDHRRRSPLIFDWFDSANKENNEKTLKSTVHDMVKEYKAKNP